ncbi:glycosyltransferase family 4 protein [Candidatus Woesebacteria bacterium]|nr:glycosyltransferase family 4 protein [Candidatus Woesebacteria bacterium]
MLKVGIDITSTIYGRGVSRYTSNVVRGLLENKNLRVTLYGASLRQRSELYATAELLKKETGSKAETVIQAYPPSLYNFLWNKIGYPKLRSVLPNIDVFHSWDWLQPPDTDLPLVSTIHDMAILRYPETAHPKIKAMHEQSWKILKKHNAHIIAVSRATKNDIVQFLGIPEDHVHVIHEALPIEMQQVAEGITEEQEEILVKKMELNRPYILFVGTREPRKNLARLIEAWLPLQDTVDLLIAGEKGWDDTENTFNNTPHLRFLGRVSDQQLSVLYTHAKLFAFPSLYEGFGLPILEAFYHGTPVVTSAISSMPEIAGNAAELVDPLSVLSIRQGIETILNESEAAAQIRTQKMIIRQHMFNWQKVTAETISVYEKAVAGFTK